MPIKHVQECFHLPTICKAPKSDFCKHKKQPSYIISPANGVYASCIRTPTSLVLRPKVKVLNSPFWGLKYKILVGLKSLFQKPGSCLCNVTFHAFAMPATGTDGSNPTGREFSDTTGRINVKKTFRHLKHQRINSGLAYKRGGNIR